MSASLQIYRNFEFGKLMKLIMLDTRIIGRDVQDYNKSTVRVLCSLPCLCTVSALCNRPLHVPLLLQYTCCCALREAATHHAHGQQANAPAALHCTQASA